MFGNFVVEELIYSHATGFRILSLWIAILFFIFFLSKSPLHRNSWLADDCVLDVRISVSIPIW